MPRSAILAAALSAMLVPNLVHADQTRFGLGIAALPQYPGAEDYRVIPAPSFSFSIGQVAVRSRGPGIEADVFTSRAFDAGPILRYNGGRDPSEIDNAAVSLLPKIDASAEVGGFVAFNYPLADDTFISPRVDVLQGLDGGHEGLTARASLGVTRRAGDWTFGGGANVTYADDDYTSSFFSVGAASPSGLAAYSAGGGILDIGVTAFANYRLNEAWSLNAVAGVSQLMGDAADSPIVTQTGSRTQAFVGFGVSYTFN